MKKFTLKALSMALALMMCLSLLTVAIPSVFADEPVVIEDKILMEQDWEFFPEGTTIVKNQTTGKDGAKVAADIGPQNHIMSEKIDGKDNKFLRLTYEGFCNVTGGGNTMGKSRWQDVPEGTPSSGVTSNTAQACFTDNCDRNYCPVHDKIDYNDGRYCVFEVSYRWDQKDSANPKVQVQLMSCTASVGDKEATPATKSWVDVFVMWIGQNKLLRESGDGIGSMTGAVEPVIGEWNDFKVVFDLLEGTYDVYLNDVLYGINAKLTRDGQLYKIIIGENQMQCGKLMKALNTYSANITGECAYIDYDNMKMYVTDLKKITMDEMPMMVKLGQKLTFKRANSTFLYADISYTDDQGDLQKYRTFDDEFTVTEDYIVGDDLKIDVHAMPGESYAATDMEFFADAQDPWNTDPAQPYFWADGSKLDVLKTLATFPQEQVTNDEGLTVSNTYMKVMLKSSGTGDGKADDNMVDANTGLNTPETSYENQKFVTVEGKYMFPAGSKASIELQLRSFKANGENKNWGNMVQIKSSGEAISVSTTGTGGTDTGAYADLGVTYDQWFKVSISLNLETGTYDVYVDDVLVKSGVSMGYTNIVLLANQINYFKLNKISNNSFTSAGFAADSWFGVDDLRFYDGKKTNFNIRLNGTDTKYSEYTSSTFNLDQFKGYKFKSAELIEMVDVEKPVQAVDAFGELQWKDPETQLEPVYVQAVDDQGQPMTDPETGAPIWETEIVQEEKRTAIASKDLPITVDLEGLTVEVFADSVIASDDFEAEEFNKDGATWGLPASYEIKTEGEGDAANKYMHIPFNGDNRDKSLQLKCEAFDAASTEPDGKFVLEIDYRWGAHGADDHEQKFQAQARGNNSTTSWASLYQVNMKTGKIVGPAPTAEGQSLVLDPNTWYSFKSIVDPVTGSYALYVDGVHVANGFLTGGSAYAAGCENFKLLANGLLVCKINKPNNWGLDGNSGPYDAGDKFVDVDNVKYRYVENFKVSYGGRTGYIEEESKLDVSANVQGKFLFASYTEGEDVVYTTDPVFTIKSAMAISVYSVGEFTSVKVADGGAQIRLGTPFGIRFLTAVSASDLIAIKNNVEAISFGTIIAPKDYVTGDFDMETLGEGKYIDVPATYGKYYSAAFSETAAAFAGSISNIKAGNTNRDFVARGYIKIEVGEGVDPIIIYSDFDTANIDDYAANLFDLATAALKATDSKTVNALKNEVVKAFVQSIVLG